jgi:hypothetical protein
MHRTNRERKGLMTLGHLDAYPEWSSVRQAATPTVIKVFFWVGKP